MTTTTTTGIAGSVAPVGDVTVNADAAHGASGGSWLKKALRPRFLYGQHNPKVPKEKDSAPEHRDGGLNLNPSRRDRIHHTHAQDGMNEKGAREMSRAGSGGELEERGE